MQKNTDKPHSNDFPHLNVGDWFQFPPFEENDEGIIASGGNLSPGMLISAYMQGIFPWYNEGEPPVWWSPNPRFVLLPSDLHIPKRLKRTLNNCPYKLTMNAAFFEVIKHCSMAKREGQDGTWILEDVIDGYVELHRLGFAHSFEAWKQDSDGNSILAGGFYGVLLGQVFCGESMFSLFPDASKCAFVTFVKNFMASGGSLIDSQVYTDHLARFGAKNISRDAFLRLEKEYLFKNLNRSLHSCYN